MKRFKSILIVLLLTVLLLVGVVLFVVLTPAGQDFLTSQISRYLRKKLETRIEIGQIRIDWPQKIGLENVLIEDLKGDTLLAAVRLNAGIDMWGLVRGKIAIDEVVLEGVRGKVYRKAPDKDFNYQFIVNAFSSPDTPEDTTSSPLDMRWDALRIKSVQLSYYDEGSGIDADVNLPEAAVDFSAFNPSFSRFHPTNILLNGGDVRLNLFEAKDLGLPIEEPVASAPGDTLDLKFGKVDFRDVHVLFADQVTGLKTEVGLPKVLAEIEDVFLEGQKISIKELSLEGAKTVVLFEPREQSSAVDSSSTQDSPGWTINLNQLALKEAEVQYDDDNSAPLSQGVDYSHLHLRNLNGQLAGFVFSSDNIAGRLANLSFQDKSGLILNQANAEFAYAAQTTYLKDLLIKTPNTTIGDKLVLKYDNQKQLTDNIGEAEIEFNLVNSRIGFKDILLLAPDLAATPPFDTRSNSFLEGTARLSGKVNNLSITEGKFFLPEGTRAVVTGTITGLPETETLGYHLNIGELSSTRSDLLSLIPKGTLPDSVRLPETLQLTGSLQGSLNDVTVDAQLITDQGNVSLAGDFRNITDSLNASYNGSLSLSDVNVGYLTMTPPEQLGKVSLKADFQGVGLVPSSANASFNGVVDRASLSGYTYQNLNLTGNLNAGIATFNASMDDKNASIAIQGKADLNQEFPSLTMEADINNIDLNKLNLYSDTIAIAGKFKADFNSTNPDNPIGKLEGNDLIIQRKDEKIPVGPLSLTTSSEGDGKQLKLESTFANVTLNGVFDYTQIGNIITAEIDRYIQLSDTLVAVPEKPYNVSLEGNVSYHPAISALVPSLTKMDKLVFNARLSNQADTTVSLSATLPAVVYDSAAVTSLNFNAAGDGRKLTYSGTIDELNNGTFRVRNFELGGTVADNLATAKITVKDSVGRNQHLAGVHLLKQGEQYTIGMDERLLLNYIPWRADTTGKIIYSEQGLLINNFSLFRNRSKERIVINSVGNRAGQEPYPNGPIRIIADSVAIGPLVYMVTRDPKLVTGRLDGNIFVRDYMGDAPVFMGGLSIDSLKVQEVSVGDFKLRANNQRADVIDLEMSLKGAHNDVLLGGKYLSGTKEPLNFNLNLNRLDGKLIEAFSFGELKEGTGNLSGELTIKGNTDNPLLNGTLALNSLGFHISQLGTKYAFQDGTIQFDAPAMNLSNLTVLDTLGQKLVVNGKILLKDIPNVGYDLKVKSDRFMLLNASRKDNDLMYGKAFAAADLSVKGKGAESVVDGNVKILKGSDVTLILPDDDGPISRGDGIVEFVSHDEELTLADTTQKEETALIVDFASELSLNIETDPDAQFTIVLDEVNGDNLQVKGNATLNTGLAPNGQLYLLGSYELEQGAYELTLEILRKQFEIRKGSQLIWSGDPMQAELDITAVYSVAADPSIFSPSNTAYGKLPFNVLLKISGNLTSPKIEFDLEVDEKAGSSVINKLNDEQIIAKFRSDPSEMNKQVFGLLLLNKFMAETANVSTEGFSAEAIARQSVSKMLSDQLNNLASDLIKGVQLDFNLNSTTGATGGRTDLNVGLTKGFMNDRVTVSVGRNFELENSGQSAQSSEIFDNIAVNYKVTRDGRYVLRAYRKNQFQTVLEGFIVETGVSFIVTLDYDAVKEFFK